MSSSYGIEPRMRHITSAQNASVKKLRALLQSPEKTAVDFAFEGDHLLAESIRAGLKLETIFLSESRANNECLTAYDDLNPTLDIVALPDSLLRSVVSTDAPQGVAAIAARPVFHFAQILAVPNPLLVIAASIQDPGNLGTLIRSAEAFGAAGVLGLPGTVSAWNQKALRASAGSTFRLPVIDITPAQLQLLRQQGIRIYAAVPDKAFPAHRTTLQNSCAIMIGNEGAGLPTELIEIADGLITIPCTGAVESLNAAVAGSIILYEASQQRRGVSQ
jgi:TrmH family RNA methyltransferase